MSNDKEFIWTDKLVEEYKYFRPLILSLETPLEQFKESKKPNKNYEILKCDSDVLGVHDYTDNQHCPCSRDNFKYCKIHSVKRLKDGEIFSVGETVNYGTIERMIISWVGLEVQFTNGCGATLASIEKVKERKPLFTTEDGKEIFEDGVCWFVRLTEGLHTSQWDINKSRFKEGPPSEELARFKFFSTEEKAREYVLMNKPVLSLKQVAEKIEASWCGVSFRPLLDELKEIASKSIS